MFSGISQSLNIIWRLHFFVNTKLNMPIKQVLSDIHDKGKSEEWVF